LKIEKYMLDELSLPYKVSVEMLERYMEYVKEPKPFVIQRHEIGKSNHGDFRLKVDNYLVGWSIVGFSEDDPFTIEKLIKNIGKGFRAETKAKQPTSWLKVEGDVKPGEVGAGVEAPGKFTILTKGNFITGAQKPYFHEYFLKDNKYFKDWTRIVVRAVKVKKIDPETKRPIPGRFERMWRIMIPKTQIPYAISNRAIKEKWKPPKDIIPFPEEWTKKNFKEQYEKWLEYMKKKEIDHILSKIKFVLALASWMGPRAKTGRRMPKYFWYLLLDDKGKGSVRTFLLDGYPLREKIMSAIEEERTNRKWLEYEGKTKPNTRFNPNKRILGNYQIVDKGTVSYSTEIKNGEEQILLKFNGKILKGNWTLLQEEKESDIYTFEKLSKESLSSSKGKFVLDIHEFPEGSKKIHYDLRWYLKGKYLDEINLYENPIKKKEDEPIKAVKKKCVNLEWIKVKPKTTRMKAYGRWSRVKTIDHGEIEIIEENPFFISMNIKGKKLKGYYVLKKNTLWIFKKSHIAKPEKESLKEEGNPRYGPYKEFIIEEKRTWNYFKVNLYDIRKFTRTEPKEKTSKYFPELQIPEGVDIVIGLYPRLGKIHGARVVYIKFDKEKWKYKDAEEWIRKNKLHIWQGIQIREKKELVEEEFRIWIKINEIDIPGREIYCEILTPTGKEEAIFGVFDDNIIQEILEKYKRGEKIFLVRIFRGYIIQIISSSKEREGPLI